MKFSIVTIVTAVTTWTGVNSECTDMMEKTLGDIQSLSFSGFTPVINRYVIHVLYEVENRKDALCLVPDLLLAPSRCSLALTL
jgi:hypothetical protein